MSSIKEKAVKIYAKYVVWRTKKWSLNPIKTQEKVFKNLLKKGKKTVFGQEHSFHNITNHGEFSSLVPIRDYEKIKETILRAANSSDYLEAQNAFKEKRSPNFSGK